MNDQSKSKKKPSMFEEEPEPLDEDDPEVQHELFATMRVMGAKPEDLPDLKDRKGYADWLELHPEGRDDEEEDVSDESGLEQGE